MKKYLLLLSSAFFLIHCSAPTAGKVEDEEDVVISSSSSEIFSSSSQISNFEDILDSILNEIEFSSSSNEAYSSSSEKTNFEDILDSILNEIEFSSSSSEGPQKSIYDAVEENVEYTSRDSVAAYLCKFGDLPSNYVSKTVGQGLYEEMTGKAFASWNFNPWATLGVMIGGDEFFNREGLLPQAFYHEADVDYNAANRGTKRLVYSAPCVIYYTADHYESFSQIAPENL